LKPDETKASSKPLESPHRTQTSTYFLAQLLLLALHSLSSLKHLDVSVKQSILKQSAVASCAQVEVLSVCRLRQGCFLPNFNQLFDHEILIIVVQ